MLSEPDDQIGLVLNEPLEEFGANTGSTSKDDRTTVLGKDSEDYGKVLFDLVLAYIRG